MSMAHSIEVRPPFLDHRIVEFAASLPAHLKIRGKAQKIVLRELMKRKLPRVHLAAEEGGVRFPGARMAARPVAQLLLDTVSADARPDRACSGAMPSKPASGNT